MRTLPAVFHTLGGFRIDCSKGHRRYGNENLRLQAAEIVVGHSAEVVQVTPQSYIIESLTYWRRAGKGICMAWARECLAKRGLLRETRRDFKNAGFPERNGADREVCSIFYFAFFGGLSIGFLMPCAAGFPDGFFAAPIHRLIFSVVLLFCIFSLGRK